MEINQIYNGDAYELIKQLPDNSVDLVVTDPPYMFDSCVGGGCFGTKKRKHKEISVALQSPSAIANSAVRDKIKSRYELQNISTGFRQEILDECCRVLKKINIYVWCSKAQVPALLNYFIDKDCNFDILAWHKTNPLPTCNNSYLNDTEYCIFAREKGVKVYGSIETKSKYWVTAINQFDKSLYHHPTIKPENIIGCLIENSSLEGEIVLDPFLGSGTTCAVAKRMNRQYVGFELDERYFKIASDRLSGITQKEVSSGFVQEKLF